MSSVGSVNLIEIVIHSFEKNYFKGFEKPHGACYKNCRQTSAKTENSTHRQALTLTHRSLYETTDGEAMC